MTTVRIKSLPSLPPTHNTDGRRTKAILHIMWTLLLHVVVYSGGGRWLYGGKKKTNNCRFRVRCRCAASLLTGCRPDVDTWPTERHGYKPLQSTSARASRLYQFHALEYHWCRTRTRSTHHLAHTTSPST